MGPEVWQLEVTVINLEYVSTALSWHSNTEPHALLQHTPAKHTTLLTKIYNNLYHLVNISTVSSEFTFYDTS